MICIGSISKVSKKVMLEVVAIVSGTVVELKLKCFSTNNSIYSKCEFSEKTPNSTGSEGGPLIMRGKVGF